MYSELARPTWAGTIRIVWSFSFIVVHDEESSKHWKIDLPRWHPLYITDIIVLRLIHFHNAGSRGGQASTRKTDSQGRHLELHSPLEPCNKGMPSNGMKASNVRPCSLRLSKTSPRVLAMVCRFRRTEVCTEFCWKVDRSCIPNTSNL